MRDSAPIESKSPVPWQRSSSTRWDRAPFGLKRCRFSTEPLMFGFSANTNSGRSRYYRLFAESFFLDPFEQLCSSIPLVYIFLSGPSSTFWFWVTSVPNSASTSTIKSNRIAKTLRRLLWPLLHYWFVSLVWNMNQEFILLHTEAELDAPKKMDLRPHDWHPNIDDPQWYAQAVAPFAEAVLKDDSAKE